MQRTVRRLKTVPRSVWTALTDVAVKMPWAMTHRHPRLREETDLVDPVIGSGPPDRAADDLAMEQGRRQR